MGLRTLRPSWEGGAGDPQVKGAVRGRDPHTTCTPPPWRPWQEMGEARLPRELTMDSSGAGLCPGRAGLDRGTSPAVPTRRWGTQMGDRFGRNGGSPTAVTSVWRSQDWAQRRDLDLRGPQG